MSKFTQTILPGKTLGTMTGILHLNLPGILLLETAIDFTALGDVAL